MPDDERISAHFIVAPDKLGLELKHGDLAAAKITEFPDGGDPGCKSPQSVRGVGRREKDITVHRL